MKKLLITALLLAVLLVTMVAAAPIIYNLDTEAGITSFVNRKNGMSVSFSDGFMSFKTENADPNFAHNFKDDAFNVDTHPYIKYRYKLDKVDGIKETQGQFFFHTNTSPAMGSSQSGTYGYFTVYVDGEWHSVIIDAKSMTSGNSSWSGKIDTFRIDPVANAGTTFTGQIDYIGFFESQEAANQYSTEAEREYEANYVPPTEALVTTVEKDNMTVIVNKDSGIADSASEDSYVMASADLSAGDTVTVIREDGSEMLLPLSINDGEKYIYIARGTGKYIPSSYSKSFEDTTGHWADEYIKFTSARKLFGGTSETEFSPEETMTRGMFITVLGRMHGVDTAKYTGKAYDDVNENEYYNPHILWAKESGILPESLTAFRPEDPITRVEMADILADYIASRSYKLAGAGKMLEFADTKDVDIHSIGSIAMMQRIGVINGRTATTFEPQGIMTRAEVATVFTRLVKSILGVTKEVQHTTEETFKGDNIIFKFDTNDNVALWTYTPKKDKGEVVVDSATGYPAVMEENGVKFARIQNVEYMSSVTAPAFDTKAYNVMSVRYRMNMAPVDSQYAYFYTDYFRINQNGYEYQKNSALIRMGKNLVGDGQWHTLNVDLSSLESIKAATQVDASNAVEGILENLRLDWRTYDGSYIDLEYVAFFDTMEQAEAFKGSADETWNNAIDATAVKVTTENLESFYPYKKDKLLIGAYDVNINTEADVKLLAEAGMNFAMTRYSNVGHRNNILKWCWQYNIDVIFFDRGFSAPYESKLAKAYAGAEKMPNYLGSSTTDEPGATKFPQLKEITDAVKAYAPDKYSYMNLFPNYASARQLEGYPDEINDSAKQQEYDKANPATMTYRQHLEKFAADIPSNDILSADIYPLLWSSNKKVTRAGYMQGVAELGDVARKNDMRLAIITQAVNYSTFVRQPDEQDYRFLIYTSLAAGTDMLSYYTYITRASESKDSYAMLDRNGVPTNIYYSAQPVNYEVQRISDTFMKYKSLGMFTVNASETSYPYLYFKEQYDNAAVKPILNTNDPVLVGCFNKKDGSAGNAYVIVNGTELQDKKTITVPVKFPTQGTVTAYYLGT
ncbi:MAG: S-layer homology domain-containing protein, partial [Clostridia bacterium]|nr:S-layer homology domain-containing protein [Clostridia bacterium]